MTIDHNCALLRVWRQTKQSRCNKDSLVRLDCFGGGAPRNDEERPDWIASVASHLAMTAEVRRDDNRGKLDNDHIYLYKKERLVQQHQTF